MLSNKKISLILLGSLFVLFALSLPCCTYLSQETQTPAADETPAPSPTTAESLSPPMVPGTLPAVSQEPCYSQSFLEENNFTLKDHVIKDFTNDDGSLIINMDADVYMPDVEHFPVAQYEFKFFTHKEVDAIVEAFTGGTPLYESIEKSGRTVDTDIFSGTQKWLGGVYALNESLDAKLQIQSDPEDQSARVVMNALFEGTNEPMILYSRDWRDYDVYEIKDQPEDMKMSPQEAMQTADDFSRRLGLDDDVRVSRIGLLVTSNVVCYEIKFLRFIEDIPFISVSTPISAHEHINFRNTPRMPEEGMVVYINDSGIIKFEWNSPLIRLPNVSEDAALKKPLDIADDFITQMDFIYSSDKVSYEYNVEFMCLNYGLARAQDSERRFIAVPVWDFFGHSSERGSDTLFHIGSSFGLTGRRDYGFITIDAVSGGIFNRDTGLSDGRKK